MKHKWCPKCRAFIMPIDRPGISEQQCCPVPTHYSNTYQTGYPVWKRDHGRIVDAGYNQDRKWGPLAKGAEV